MEDPQTQDDPTQVLAPFYTAELNHRERVRFLVGNLTDEELTQVHGLFAKENLRQVPYEFWTLAARVRALIRHEKQARKEKEPVTL